MATAMATLAPTFTVSRNDDPREVHYSLGGLIDAQTLMELQKELYRAAKPWIESGLKFRVLGDMRDFQVQQQEIADLIRKSQVDSVRLGMEKMAILYSGALMKLQFRRISEVVDIEFFESKVDAIAWLRANEA